MLIKIMDGEFFNVRIWGHDINISSIPGGVTKGKENDRYIIRFKEKLEDHIGPTMMVMAKRIDLNGEFRWLPENNSRLFGENWTDFLNELGQKIDLYNIEKERRL